MHRINLRLILHAKTSISRRDFDFFLAPFPFVFLGVLILARYLLRLTAFLLAYKVLICLLSRVNPGKETGVLTSFTTNFVAKTDPFFD